jgi:hypothetical protein
MLWIELHDFTTSRHYFFARAALLLLYELHDRVERGRPSAAIMHYELFFRLLLRRHPRESDGRPFWDTWGSEPINAPTLHPITGVPLCVAKAGGLGDQRAHRGDCIQALLIQFRGPAAGCVPGLWCGGRRFMRLRRGGKHY